MTLPSLFAARFVLGSAFLLLFVVPSLGQRLVDGTKAATARVPGFSAAFCSTLSGTYSVCKVLTSDNEDSEYIIRKGTAVVNRIKGPYWMTAGNDPDDFFAYRGDLDRNGTREIVLVSLEGVSQGMGVTYATAYIFDGGTVESFGKPISFSIQEFGEDENFIYNPRDRRTEILISYWDWYDSIEPRRITGTYLIGKWFRYRSGKLEPILTRPTLARRFLNSFAAERDNGWFENRKPFTWLRDRRTHKLFAEPAESSPLVKVQVGAIGTFDEQQSRDIDRPEFDFVTDDRQAIKGKINRGGTGSDEEKATLDIRDVGIWETRYLYPVTFSGGFRPSTFLDRIEGRKVRLETYKPEYGDEFTMVWLLD